MNKKAIIILLFVLGISLSSFSVHKFYVSIYQVDFVPQKKRIEITARIFMDDLNVALEHEFKTKTHIGEKTESTQDVVFLQKYMTSHVQIFINNKEKKVLFLSKEIENNVVVVYLKVSDISKIDTFKIQNNALLDLNSDQQNIIQTNFYNNKRNYIFTGDYFIENIKIK